MNNRTIQTVALEEIYKQNVDGNFPVLLEIYNPDIKWGDDELEQENMYLRIINDTNPVVYKGKHYLPSQFVFTPPTEDGKTVGESSITMSAIDSRIVQMLRSIEIPCKITITAAFAKKDSTYMFYPFDNFKATIPSANYDRTQTNFTLTWKNVMNLQVPRNKATKDQLPSIGEK